MNKKENLLRLHDRVKKDLFVQNNEEATIQKLSPQILEYVQCSSHGELMEETFQISIDQRNRKFQDDYQIGKILGEGAHSVVRQCWQISNPDETYAVKITRNGDPEIMGIMKQTFLNTLKLNNPLIVRTYKLYIDTNTECSYLVMEYLPYPSLHELLKQNILTQENKLSILRQCLEATQYLHRMGLCHRDLKPDNILFDQDTSTIKIIDFGVSKRFITTQQRDIQVQLLWTITGNENYRAPELWSGSGYNELIDVWAIGVIAYQMLCHKLPITNENRMEFNENENQQQYLLSTEFKSLDSLSQDLLKRLLSFNPNKRITASQALVHPLLYQTYSISQLQFMKLNSKQYTKDDMLMNNKIQITAHSSQAIKYLQQSQEDHQNVTHDFKNKCFIDAIHQTDKDTSQQMRNRSIHFQQSINSLCQSISTKPDEVKEFFDIVQKCDSHSSLDSLDDRIKASSSPPNGLDIINEEEADTPLFMNKIKQQQQEFLIE
ncbi:unnamed protein product [Paramecium octaurelia]|uniref:Protein kinase domain-containing protein n=1 Tax=Paramecium octaurelia TaxID=43137 RepID=A0A8S1VRP0_PAROT|nr:unnamed protein product [Paramecium octaurelia]